MLVETSQENKRFLSLIVFTFTVCLFNITLIQLKLKKPNQNDFKNHNWSNLKIHNLKGQISTTQANLLDKNFFEIVNKSKPAVRQGMTQTTTIRYLSSHIETLDDDQNHSVNIVTGNASFVAERYNVTERTNRELSKRISTMMTHSILKHPKGSEQDKLVPNEYKKDLMSVGPFHFLQKYKNPCWELVERKNKVPVIRCLPYFYLIGAPKSGTSDLHSRLIKHPDISRLVIKEPHWLTRRQYFSPRGRKSGSDLNEYLRYFSFATIEIITKKDANGYHSKIFGDCSASTIWDNKYWTKLPQYQNLTEPLYTNADYIHHLNPNTKIIAMLRHPVDRLYSDYLYFNHGTPEEFHKRVVHTINETRQCLNRYSLRHCIYTKPKNNATKRVRLQIGIYHMHLKEFFRVFPRDQVMVIKLEDFSKDTMAYMQKIFAFLNVSELDMIELQRIANPNKLSNLRRMRDRKTGEMLQVTREILEKFYYPHNELLTQLLGEQFNYNRDSNRDSNRESKRDSNIETNT